jgi:hypothetical protein
MMVLLSFQFVISCILLSDDDNDDIVGPSAVTMTYLHTTKQKFIACAQSPLGKECFDFNDATNFSYFRGIDQTPFSSGDGCGRLVEKNDFPSSVNANVRNTEVRYNAVFLIAAWCRWSCRSSSCSNNEVHSFQSMILLLLVLVVDALHNDDDAFDKEPHLQIDNV